MLRYLTYVLYPVYSLESYWKYWYNGIKVYCPLFCKLVKELVLNCLFAIHWFHSEQYILICIMPIIFFCSFIFCSIVSDVSDDSSQMKLFPPEVVYPLRLRSFPLFFKSEILHHFITIPIFMRKYTYVFGKVNGYEDWKVKTTD